MLKLIILIGFAIFASSFVFERFEAEILREKCCTACKLPTLKYISLRNNKCGQACIDPKDYNKVKLFEPTLELAKTNTPCADLTYT